MGCAAEQAGAGEKGRLRAGKKEGKLARPPAMGRRRARQAGKGEEEGRAGSGVGPVGEFFPKSNIFPILFSPFPFLSQIQISFEFTFKSSSPTLNQKPYDSA